MNTFFIDESGTMTKKYLKNISNQYFVVCLVKAIDDKKLKRAYQRFVRSNLSNLRKEDKHHSMFYKNGKFKELKGSYMSYEMKKKFINYFCQNNLINIYYICSSNLLASEYFYSNKARAFNYLIRLSMEYNSNNCNLNKDMNYLNIDERNVSTNTRSTLEEYLNTELVTARNLQLGFIVEYYQSESRALIQIADVFSNIYYSYINKGNRFDNEIEFMRNNNYIRNEFYFPYNY